MTSKLTNQPAPQPAAPEPSGLSARLSGKQLLLVLALLAAALTAVGWVYVARVQADARETARHELSAIADLKLQRIQNWRQERLSDARFFSNARFVAEDLKRFVAEPNSAEARAAMLHWLRLLKGGDRYSGVVVFGPAGEPWLAVPAGAQEPREMVRQEIQQAVQRRDGVMTDLHRHGTNAPVELQIMFPIFEPEGAQAGTLLGAGLLKLDARQFLFPLVQTWPTPSRTAETLLVRQEGNEVLYLNDLRHRPGSALSFRMPMTRSDLPGVRVLNGETEVIDGIDYRGVPVVAAGRKIPGTAWALVAKVDQAEVYGPLRRQLLLVLLVLGMVMVAGGLAAGLLWRQRHARFLQRELALEKERAALAERVAHLMRNANDAILLVSLNGRILEANERALQSYGYTLAEIQQKRVHDLRTPEAARNADQDLARVKSQSSLFLETVHRRNNGAAFPVEVSSRKVRVGGEEFILSIIRDITQRKAHEREIERLNRLYAALSQVNLAVVRAESREELLKSVCQALVKSGGFGLVWVGWLDGAGRPLQVVAECGDELGILKGVRVYADDRPEGRGMVGRALREGRTCVCDDTAQAAELAPWREALARAGLRSMAALPIRREGGVCGALAVYARQQDFFGKQEQALVEEAASDVSFGLDMLLNARRRREAEEQLRLQAAALHSAANSIVITNREGMIQWVNPAFERLTGYTAAEAMGENPRLLSSGCHDSAFFQRMWEMVTSGQVWHEEVINKRKDGSVYTEEMTITPVRDSRGEITHFIAIKQDVTARKQAEEAVRRARDELAKANAELERRVQERTAQLRESVAELEAFSYSVSHDLRAPLRTISSFAAMALDDYGEKLGADGCGLLARVVNASRRMDRLMSDVLSLSQVSRAQIRLAPVDTEKVVRQIVQERPELNPSQAEVRIESPLAGVLGHEALLTQCLANLLGNGVKYVARGVRPQVRVWTEIKDGESGRSGKRGESGESVGASELKDAAPAPHTVHAPPAPPVRIWVEDNGIGIPREAQEKIFEVFQRLHKQEEYAGTGIGLSIVRKAVERMGGRVGVESEPGKGSRFWVELQSAEGQGG